MTLDLDKLRELAEKARPMRLTIPKYPEGEKAWVQLVNALDPQTVLALVDAARLGHCFARVEAALPERATLTLTYWPHYKAKGYLDAYETTVEADDFDVTRVGPTPEAALEALHAALPKAKP